MLERLLGTKFCEIEHVFEAGGIFIVNRCLTCVLSFAHVEKLVEKKARLLGRSFYGVVYVLAAFDEPGSVKVAQVAILCYPET